MRTVKSLRWRYIRDWCRVHYYLWLLYERWCVGAWELMYADDLWLMAESIGGLKKNVIRWKECFGKKHWRLASVKQSWWIQARMVGMFRGQGSSCVLSVWRVWKEIKCSEEDVVDGSINAAQVWKVSHAMKA